MQLKTILNRVHPVKGFVYEKVSWASDAAAPCGLRLDVRVRARRGSRGICSGCGRRGPGYDTLSDRRFDFVPLWGIAVVLVYALRRVHCDRCGVKVEAVPWAEPGSKQAATRALEVFLAAWAKRLSWREVGLEQSDKSSVNIAPSKSGGAKSGAANAQAISDHNLSKIFNAWAKLPEAVRRGILAMIEAAGGEAP